MKIAFLKGTKIFDRLIKLWTWSSYSHCEYVFSDNITIGTDLNFPLNVKNKGILQYTSKWEIIEVRMTPEQEKIVRDFVNLQVGKGYDWKGIWLSQFLPLKKENPDKWFCSELCAAGLQKAGLLDCINPCRISPGKLYKLLKSLSV